MGSIQTIVIHGQPIAKKRPRFARRGNFVTTYNPQETEEGRMLWEIRQQYTGEPTTKPVYLFLRFEMEIPKSASKKRQAEMESHLIEHTKRPDLDNLAKMVKDVCNNVLWRDDSQITRMEAVKMYSLNPKTVIEFMEAP